MKRVGQRRASGFSLVELLVVMGIMGLLFAILLPAIGAVRRSASRAQARQMVRSIESAMLAYHAEYGRFPLQHSGSGTKRYRLNRNIDGVEDETFSEYNEVIRILANRPPEDFAGYPAVALNRDVTSIESWQAAHNPRRMTFLEIEILTVTDYDVEAIVEDPWGNPYRIAADWSMQRNVNTDTDSGSPSDGHGMIRNHAVAVWSINARVPERYGNFSMPPREEHITSWSQ